MADPNCRDSERIVRNRLEPIRLIGNIVAQGTKVVRERGIPIMSWNRVIEGWDHQIFPWSEAIQYTPPSLYLIRVRTLHLSQR